MKPLSPNDSIFLWMETRSQPMHVAGLNLYTPPRVPERTSSTPWCRGGGST